MFETDSGKFWEIWRDGSTVFTRFGRAGYGAQTTLREEGSEAQADHAIEKLVQAKSANGFYEAGSVRAPTKTGELDADELRRQIDGLPDLVEDHAFAVFGDWLQSKGHPWGELIAMQHAAQTAPAKKRAELDRAVATFLEQHGETIVGKAAKSAFSRFEWHLGFLRTATIGTAADPASIAAAVDDLLAQPVAARLQGLVINAVPARFETNRDWDNSVNNVVNPWTELEALAQKLPERIKHVGFGGWPVSAASAYLRMPSYTQINALFPRLRRLELTGYPPDEPGNLDLPDLVDLEVRFGQGTYQELGVIRESKIDKLERIAVWLGGSANVVLDSLSDGDDFDYDGGGSYPDSYDGDDLEKMEVYDVNATPGAETLGEFIDALPESIKHLGLNSCVLDEATLEVILARPILAKLETLDLSGGTLEDPKPLIAAKKSLAHLKVLNVERNLLSAAAAKKLAAALPNARVEHQREAKHPELFFRYVATME